MDVKLNLVLSSSEGQINVAASAFPYNRVNLKILTQTWAVQLDNGKTQKLIELGSFTPENLANCIEEINKLLAACSSDIQLNFATPDGKVGREAVIAIAEQTLQDYVESRALAVTAPLLESYRELIG